MLENHAISRNLAFVNIQVFSNGRKNRLSLFLIVLSSVREHARDKKRVLRVVLRLQKVNFDSMRISNISRSRCHYIILWTDDL